MISLLSVLLCSTSLVAVDFTGEMREVSVEKVGSFRGVLPKDVDENFASWGKAAVTTEIGTEGSGRYLRFETAYGTALSSGQFRLRSQIAEPGYYRLQAELRTRSSSVLFQLRQPGAPYRVYWSELVFAPDWRTCDFTFELKGLNKGGAALFVLPGPGSVDLRSCSLERLSRDEYLAGLGLRRPKVGGNAIRHTRFPLGLPSGWSHATTALDAVVTVGRAEDGVGSLVFLSETDTQLNTEPFLSPVPGGSLTARLYYRSAGDWRTEACASCTDSEWTRACAATNVDEAVDWRTCSFDFVVPENAEAMTLRFTGRGRLEIGRLEVFSGPSPNAQPEVTLHPGAGEISALTRVHFVDEPARARWAVVGAPPEARLCLEMADLYGRKIKLPDISLKGLPLETGEFTYDTSDEMKLGQFCLTAHLEKNGVVLSSAEELVMTRLPRPLHFADTFRDSYFGTHLEAKPSTLLMAKAAGVNWTRFHDAGWKYSCWAELEKEKGRWQFHDREINRIAAAKLSIFAQLGTAPDWATRIKETKLQPGSYFAKYLRPTEFADFATYVETFVTRYRDVIHDYFIWNEPWGQWWVNAADASLYGGDRAERARQFGQFSCAASRVVKRVDPAASVSGFNTTEGDSAWFNRELVKAGVMENCDAIDFHCYTPHPLLVDPREGNITRRALAAIEENYPNYAGRKLIMSEGQATSAGNRSLHGRRTGLYREILPYRNQDVVENHRLANQTVRYLLKFISEGVSRVFLYSMNYRSMAEKPQWGVLVGADGFPHPELVAHAQLARMIDGRRCQGVRPHAGSRGFVIEFEGGVDVYVGLDKSAVMALAQDARLTVRDIYGNPVTEETFLADSVIYVKGGAK